MSEARAFTEADWLPEYEQCDICQQLFYSTELACSDEGIWHCRDCDPNAGDETLSDILSYHARVL